MIPPQSRPQRASWVITGESRMIGITNIARSRKCGPSFRLTNDHEGPICINKYTTMGDQPKIQISALTIEYKQADVGEQSSIMASINIPSDTLTAHSMHKYLAMPLQIRLGAPRSGDPDAVGGLHGIWPERKRSRQAMHKIMDLSKKPCNTSA